MTEGRRYFVVQDGQQKNRKLSYLEYGAENQKNVLLCVHGLSRNARDFTYIARALSREWRVISVDVPGRGESDPYLDPRRYSYESYTEDLLALVDALGVQKLHWFGTSMGGILALFVARKRPELIARLILNDIGPVVKPKVVQYLQHELPKFYRNGRFASHVEFLDMMEKSFLSLGLAQESHKRDYLSYSAYREEDQYVMRFDPKIFTHLNNDLSHRSPDEMWSMWDALADVPVLEMWGGKSIFLTGDIVKRMRSTHTQMTVCRCMRCGHVCNLMDANQIDVIRLWLTYPKITGDITLWS